MVITFPTILTLWGAHVKSEFGMARGRDEEVGDLGDGDGSLGDLLLHAAGVSDDQAGVLEQGEEVAVAERPCVSPDLVSHVVVGRVGH